MGFVLFWTLHKFSVIKVAPIPMDVAGFVSLLPTFLFFCSGVIAGSKALAAMPLASFIAATNGIPAAVTLAERAVDCREPSSSSSPQATTRSLAASTIVVITSIALLFFSESEADSKQEDSPQFWAAIHVVCHLGLTLHSRISDARFNGVDRQYYSYIFALVVLTPASLYLEEAFTALKFEALYQFYFIAGSLVSAILGVLLFLYQSRLKTDANFGRVHHVAAVLTALLSLFVFDASQLSYVTMVLCMVSYLGIVFVPTHITKDEEKLVAAEDDEEELTPRSVNVV